MAAGHYRFLLQEKYWGRWHWTGPRRTDGERVPTPTTLPSGFDAERHPLWFDGSSGVAALSTVPNFLFEKEKFGDMDRLYADWSRLDDRMADEVDQNVFKYSQASWPDIKSSFEELVRLYPHGIHD